MRFHLSSDLTLSTFCVCFALFRLGCAKRTRASERSFIITAAALPTAAAAAAAAASGDKRLKMLKPEDGSASDVRKLPLKHYGYGGGVGF